MVLHYFHPEELFALLRYPIFPVLVGLAFLLVGLASVFNWKQVRTASMGFLLGAQIALILRHVVLFVTERRIVFSSDIEYIPFTAFHFATLETLSTLALVTFLLLLIRRSRAARTFLLIHVPVAIVLLVLTFLADRAGRQLWVVWAMHLQVAVMLDMLARTASELSDYADPDQPHLVRSTPSLRTSMRWFLAANFLYAVAPLLDSQVVTWLGHGLSAVGSWYFMIFSQHIGAFGWLEAKDHVEAVEKESKITVNLFEMISNRISSANDQAEVFWLIADAASRITGAQASCLWIWSEKKSAFEAVSVYGVFPPLRVLKQSEAGRPDQVIAKTKAERFGFGKTYAGAVAESKEPLLVNDLLDKPHSLVEQTAPGMVDLKSLIVSPIVEDGKTIGVVAAANKDDLFSRFTKSDLNLLGVLAQQTVLALQHFRLIQESILKKVGDRDVSIASNIQQGLLPSGLIKVEHIEFHGFSVAAKGVGGDYFDLLEFGDSRYGIIMSDVAGKGIPASLVMVMISAVFRTWGTYTQNTKDVVEKVNAALCRSVSEDRYATFFYYILDADKGTIKYSNAAHGPLLVYRYASDSFELLDTGGMPVGISPDTEYEEKESTVENKDLLVLYTDGITECMNLDRDQYTIDRLKEQIRAHRDLPVDEMNKTIYAHIKAFAGEAPQHDDETLVITRVLR